MYLSRKNRNILYEEINCIYFFLNLQYKLTVYFILFYRKKNDIHKTKIELISSNVHCINIFFTFYKYHLFHFDSFKLFHVLKITSNYYIIIK